MNLRKEIAFAVLGLILLAAGALIAFVGTFGAAPAYFIVAGTGLTVVAAARISLAQKEGQIEDERDRRIRRAGIEYSWLGSFLLACAMYFLDLLGILRLSGREAFVLMIFALGVLGSAAQLWLSRKGDVD